MTEHNAETVERMAEAIWRAGIDFALGPEDAAIASWDDLREPFKGAAMYEARAALSALTVEDAAKVLLDACPNPIFDNLKYPLLGEFTQTQCYVDENGDEDSMIVTIEWCVIKEIIEAALRAIADTPKEGE